MKLKSRRIFTVLACLLSGLLLIKIMLPDLQTGFHLDDYLWWSTQHKSQVAHNDLRSFLNDDLSWALTRGFTFFDGDPKRTSKLMDIGLAPWWTASDLKVNFFRPLSSLTHWLDFELWSDRPDLMHIHNLLWLGAFLIALGLFFSVFFTSSTWFFPLFAVAFSEPISHPAGWILGRNLLMVGTFCFLSLYFYISYLKNDSKLFGALGIISLLFSLMSHESGILTFILAALYTVLLDTRPLKARFKSIVPFFIVSLAWQVCYRILGYGVLNSGFYVDVLREPHNFLKSALFHMQTAFFHNSASPFPVIYSLSLIILIIFFIFRRSREIMFWTSSFLCVFLIMCAGPTQERLRLLICVCFIGLSWQILIMLNNYCRDNLGNKIRLSVCSLFIAFFIIAFSPQRITTKVDRSTGISPDLQEPFRIAKDKNLIVLNVHALHLSFFYFTLVYYDFPLPKSMFPLLVPSYHYSITFESSHSIVLRNDKGLFDPNQGDFFRSASRPFKLGEEIRLSNVTIKILEIDERGIPKQIKFDFNTPIFNADNVLFIYEEGKYKQITPESLPNIKSLSWHQI